MLLCISIRLENETIFRDFRIGKNLRGSLIQPSTRGGTSSPLLQSWIFKTALDQNKRGWRRLEAWLKW
jgi:hypothetical protein